MARYNHFAKEKFNRVMTDKQIEIDKVTELPDVYIHSDGGIQIKNLSSKKIVLSKETLEAYHDALNPDLSFGFRFKQFLKAENEAGRIAKSIKDFALLFLPYGEQIDDLTEFVQMRILNSEDDMKPVKKRKSTAIIIFGLLFLAGLIQKVFAVDLGLELHPDAEWVMIGSGIVGVIIRLFTNKPVNWGKLLQTVTGRQQA